MTKALFSEVASVLLSGTLLSLSSGFLVPVFTFSAPAFACLLLTSYSYSSHTDVLIATVWKREFFKFRFDINFMYMALYFEFKLAVVLLP